MAFNLMLPVGVQLAAIERIETKLMPWGEPFASAVGPMAPTFWIAITAILSILVHSVVQFWSSWRRHRSGTSLLMMVSTAVYLAAGIEGILVRAQIVHFVHLGVFGFFFMVIAMSLTLSYRSRQILMVSEQRFRALVEQSPFGIQVLAIDGGTVQVNPAWERLWGKNASENPRVADERLLPVIERAFLGHKGETNPSAQGRWPVDSLVRLPVQGSERPRAQCHRHARRRHRGETCRRRGARGDRGTQPGQTRGAATGAVASAGPDGGRHRA